MKIVSGTIRSKNKIIHIVNYSENSETSNSLSLKKKIVMIFDLVFLLAFAWAAYRGFTKGIIIQAAGLAALILGVFGAIKFSDFTAMQILSRTDYQGNRLTLIAFVVTFILIVIGVHLVARLTDKLVKAVALGFVNRILGVVFGLLKSAFIISIVLVVLNTIHYNRPFLPEKKLDESILYDPLASFAPMVFPHLHFDLPNNFASPIAQEKVYVIK